MIEVPDETFYFLLGHYLLSNVSNVSNVSGQNQDPGNIRTIFNKTIFGAFVWYLYVISVSEEN